MRSSRDSGIDELTSGDEAQIKTRPIPAIGEHGAVNMGKRLGDLGTNLVALPRYRWPNKYVGIGR